MRLSTLFAAALLAVAGPTAALADQLLLDGSFETPLAADVPGSVHGFAPLAGLVDGWTYDNAGVVDAATAAPFYAGAAPEDYAGDQYAFIRGGGSLSQTVVADFAGFFSVSVRVAGNPGFAGAGSDQTLEFAIDGVVLQTLPFGGGSDFVYTSDNIPTLAGVSHTVAFTGLSAGNDVAFIDDVFAGVTFGAGFVPEPASWGMMIAGFGLVGAAARRRRGLAAA